jgi:hypothetical protein
MKPMLTSEEYFNALLTVRDEQCKDNQCPTCGGYGAIKKPKNDKGDQNDNSDGNGQGQDQNDQSQKGDSQKKKDCNNHNSDGEQCDCEGNEKSPCNGESDSNSDEYMDCPDCGGCGAKGGCSGHGGSGSGSDDDLNDMFGMDDHGLWDDIPDDLREYINARIRNVVEKAVTIADQQSNGWGNIPVEIAAEIRRSISRKVPWRSVLKQYIGTTIPGDRMTSIKRINKRYPYIHPGLKRGRRPKLLVAIDQSGSVSDEMMMIFFAELTSLAKNCDIDILPFDCVANEKEIYTWKKGAECPKGRQHAGGTNFDAPTEVANASHNRGRWDGLLIVTDGEAPAPVASRIKRGWVLGPKQKLYFESNELQVFVDQDRPMVGAWR